MKCINQFCRKKIGDVKFCPYCGTKQEKPKVFCIYCGAEMDEDAIFCNECGSKSFFVQQQEVEEQRAKEKAEREKLARIEEEKKRAEERAAEESRRKEHEEQQKKEQIAALVIAAEQRAKEKAEREKLARIEEEKKCAEERSREKPEKIVETKNKVLTSTAKNNGWQTGDFLGNCPISGHLFPAWDYSTRKYGYIDIGGRMVIEPQFSSAEGFSDGMSIIRDDHERYGFIDESGHVVIPPHYEKANFFSDGLARVTLEGRECFIDKNGKVAFYCKNKVYGPYYDGIALVHNLGKGGYGFVDKTGAYVIKPINGNIEVGYRFTEGLAWFRNRDTNYWGYIDRTGNVAIEAKFYDYAGVFSEGLAQVRDGWIDKNGEYVISGKNYRSFRLLARGRFSDGLAPFGSESGPRKYGFVDKKGTIVIDLTGSVYGMPDEFSEGRAKIWVKSADGKYKYGFIDTSGREVIPPIYDFAYKFNNGLARVNVGNTIGYINNNGEVVYRSARH